MKKKIDLPLSAFVYPVLLLAGFTFVYYTWRQSLFFVQGNVVEAPYFLLAVLATVLLLVFSVRLICAFRLALKQTPNSELGAALTEAAGFSPQNGKVIQRAERVRLRLDFAMLYITVAVYCAALFRLGFVVCTFFYLFAQSVWLRRRLRVSDSFFNQPSFWIVHLTYAGLLTFALGCLLHYLLMIEL